MLLNVQVSLQRYCGYDGGGLMWWYCLFNGDIGIVWNKKENIHTMLAVSPSADTQWVLGC